MADEGLITIESAHPVKDTIDRVESSLAAKEVAVFARIDHAAGAALVGMSLRQTELLIFGYPKAGTPLMQSRQSIGIDLPLKLLGWQDEGGKVWLSYNDPGWIARRHQLDSDAMRAVDAGAEPPLVQESEVAPAPAHGNERRDQDEQQDEDCECGR